MKVVCGWCQKNMGEKCLKCGSHHLVWNGEDCAYFCPACNEHFYEGEGGTSHSICHDCEPKLKG